MRNKLGLVTLLAGALLIGSPELTEGQEVEEPTIINIPEKVVPEGTIYKYDSLKPIIDRRLRQSLGELKYSVEHFAESQERYGEEHAARLRMQCFSLHFRILPHNWTYMKNEAPFNLWAPEGVSLLRNADRIIKENPVKKQEDQEYLEGEMQEYRENMARYVASAFPSQYREEAYALAMSD